MSEFFYKTGFSVIGTQESVVAGLAVDDRKIGFTGVSEAVEDFGISAEELALFAGNADSVHFVRETVYIPVIGAGLNDPHKTEEIAVLTVRAVKNKEVINAAQISRVVSRF